MIPSFYDPIVLMERAKLWKIEAEASTLAAMRAFCLEEAEKCEQLASQSLVTPVLR